MIRTSNLALGAAFLASALLVSSCGYDETPLPEPPKAAPTTPAPPADCTSDASTLASYDPSQSWPGDAIERIKDRGRLIVGVSADTYRMAAPNRESGVLEGFDIEIAKAIARRIFGADFRLGRNIQWRVITAADRIRLLEEGEVDLVVRAFTINCDRWSQIAFSAQYYHATQKVLLREDLADDYNDVSDLDGVRVCAPTGSTSLTNITAVEDGAIVVPAANHTGCLVKLQQGDVDAITGDDTVLAGLAAQDPFAVVPEDQPELAPSDDGEPPYGEPYGVGANAADKDLVALVNDVLEELRNRQPGQPSWDQIYARYLEDFLGPASQPEPLYGRS